MCKVSQFSILLGLAMPPTVKGIKYERVHIKCEVKGNYSLGNIKLLAKNFLDFCVLDDEN